MNIRIAVAAIFIVWSIAATPASAKRVTCDDWNTKEFFQSASMREVSHCLKAGAMKYPLSWGMTPLHNAGRFSKHPSVMTALVKAGYKVYATNGFGFTPLHIVSAYNKDPRFVRALVKAGAKVNAQQAIGGDFDSVYGLTPLLVALIYGNESDAVIIALLKAGAEPNAQARDGQTALHFALKKGRSLTVVEALLDAGALPNMPSLANIPACYYAERNRNIKGTDVYRRLVKGCYR